MFKFKNKKVTCDLSKVLKIKNIKKLDYKNEQVLIRNRYSTKQSMVL